MRAASAACIVLLLADSGAMAQPLASTDAASHVGKAVRLMQDRRFSEAAAEFEQALAADPNNDAVRIQYATCLFAQERNDEARKQFEIERQRLGDQPGLNYYLGRLDLRASDFTSAIKKLAPLESDPRTCQRLSLSRPRLPVGWAAGAGAWNAWSGPPETIRAIPRSITGWRAFYSMAGRTDDANREYKLYRDSR